MPDAIIFVPPGPAAAPWLTICAAYCTRKGYSVVAVVRDWDDVVRMLKDDGIEVVVIGRRDHLPAERRWRIESISEPARNDPPPERRRPNRRR